MAKYLIKYSDRISELKRSKDLSRSQLLTTLILLRYKWFHFIFTF